jgi:hypothetical protein
VPPVVSCQHPRNIFYPAGSFANAIGNMKLCCTVTAASCPFHHRCLSTALHVSSSSATTTSHTTTCSQSPTHPPSPPCRRRHRRRHSRHHHMANSYIRHDYTSRSPLTALVLPSEGTRRGVRLTLTRWPHCHPEPPRRSRSRTRFSCRLSSLDHPTRVAHRRGRRQRLHLLEVCVGVG